MTYLFGQVRASEQWVDLSLSVDIGDDMGVLLGTLGF
jgi:hypothetical protein